jgi:hypothetical protein
MFNTAQIIDGMAALAHHSGDERWRDAAIRAALWLADGVDAHGAWSNGQLSQGRQSWVLRALQGDRLNMPVGLAAGSRQRQCFVVAPALRELAARRLAQRCAPSSQAPAPPVFAEFDGGAVET